MRRLGMIVLALVIYGILALVHSRTTLLSLCTPADWTGKVVLITGTARPRAHKTHYIGASLGIGKQLAWAFARSGATLILVRARLHGRTHQPPQPDCASELAAVRVRLSL